MGRAFEYEGTCAHELCNNRGTCQSFRNDTSSTSRDLRPDEFACHCSTGWTGERCEQGKYL